MIRDTESSCAKKTCVPKKVEMWKVVQVYYVDMKGRNIGKWVHSNGKEWLVSRRQFVVTWCYYSLYRACCYNSYKCMKSVERRGSYAGWDELILDHVMRPQHGCDGSYIFIHIVSQCWNTATCWTYLLQHFIVFWGLESWLACHCVGFHCPWPPTPLTELVMWLLSLARRVVTCSVFG